LIPGHPKITRLYQEDPGIHLIVICHRNAECVRIEAVDRNKSDNIRYFGSNIMRNKDEQLSRAIKETVQICDAREEEMKHVMKKFPSNYEVIDMNVRNCFPIRSIKISTLKCYCGYNHYAARDSMVCYRETYEMKVDFIIDIKTKLMKVKHKIILEEVIDQIIRDI